MAASAIVQVPAHPPGYRPRSAALRQSGTAPGHAYVETGTAAEINLLVEREDAGHSDVSKRLQALALSPDETIQSIKLKLRLRGFFRGSSATLALGDRELLDHELVGALAKSPEHVKGGYLHVLVRLTDVEAVSVTTSEAREFSFRPPSSPGHIESPRPSTPTPIPGSASLDKSVVLRSRMAASTALLAACPSPYGSDASGAAGTAIVHLVIRRSAKVTWHAGAGNQFELCISAADTAASVKRRIQEHTDLPADRHSLVYNGRSLSSSCTLLDYGIQEGATLELVPLDASPAGSPTGSPPLSSPEHGLFESFEKARRGLTAGQLPRLAPAGTGGSYFLAAEDGRNVAVFKPEDEEPLAINNPRGLPAASYSLGAPGSGLRRGVMPGEGAIREVAAYVLDHDHFAGVPPTALISCQRAPVPHGAGQCADADAGAGAASPPCSVKVGSLQQFVAAETDCEERGPGAFPVHEVHKIAQLDMRLANTDRNGGNILARQVNGEWQLVPIDHGYCLPSSFQDISFEWLHWRQARVPFDAATRAYIAKLDAQRDLATLAAHGLRLRPECARVLRACTMLLQKGAARGLAPADIGAIMVRDGLGKKSVLEKLHARAAALAAAEAGTRARTAGNGDSGAARRPPMAHEAGGQGTCDDDAYLRHLGELMTEYLDELHDELVLEALPHP